MTLFNLFDTILIRQKNNFYIFIFCSIQNSFIFADLKGTLAQLVEQWTENPCVPGSIPGGTTLKP
jgi:hypothetical protein